MSPPRTSPIPTPADRGRTRARARAVGQVLLASSLFSLPVSHLAQAYVGGALLGFAATYIIAPVGLLAVVIAVADSLFRPEFVSKAIYAALICAVLFFLISQGQTVMSAFQS